MSIAIIDGSSNKKGRFGNQFIRAMAVHFIAQKLKIQPKYPPIDLEKFGLQFYQLPNELKNTPDNEKNKEIINLKEENFMDYLGLTPPHVSPNTCLNLNLIWCLNSNFTFKMWEYLRNPDVKTNIVAANPNKGRYDNNNDLFIHVRLGDVIDLNPGVKYYDDIIKKIKFDKGYIASDSLHHPICIYLRKKYKLRPLMTNDLYTIILFGSTCRHLIISNGTFSWILGAFAFYSAVHYPDIKVTNWHNDIYFNLPRWIKHEWTK